MSPDDEEALLLVRGILKDLQDEIGAAVAAVEEKAARIDADRE